MPHAAEDVGLAAFGVALHEHAPRRRGEFDILEERFPGEARRIIFMTGGTFEQTSAAFVARIRNSILLTPFSLNELLAVIENALARQPTWMTETE